MLGDKYGHHLTESSLEHMRDINGTHIPDIVFERAGPQRRGLVVEVRCYTPYVADLHGGTEKAPPTVGDRYAFGNTEDRIRRDALGWPERGSPTDPPFDYRTGRGRVTAHAAQYRHALAKRKSVVPVVMEPTGAVCPHAYAVLRSWHQQARLHRIATGRTRYHWSAPSFLTHHSQRISIAVVFAEAAQIQREFAIRQRRRRDTTACM